MNFGYDNEERFVVRKKHQPTLRELYGNHYRFETDTRKFDSAANRRRGGLILGGLFAASAAAIGLVACYSTDPVQLEPLACSFSTETTQVTLSENEGKNDVLLEIKGVNFGTCMDSAETIVENLNPELNLNAPHVGDRFNIPVSATFNP